MLKPTPAVALNRKRDNIKDQLTKISNALLEKENVSPCELELKFNTLQNLKKKKWQS